jgi:hypothetical protein
MTPALAATLAVSAVEPLERAILRAEPVYSARSIARRLLGKRAGRLSATALRYGYGLALGTFVSRGLRLRSAVGIAAAVSSFELVALPVLGLTPPPRRWPPRQRFMLLLHTLAFGVVLKRASA